jgi:hypothetical protein
VPASPSRSSWWREVARGFCVEQLDELERIVVPLVDREVVPLLRPQLAGRHEAVVARVHRLDWNDPAAPGTAFDILAAIVPASDDDGDVPFTLTLARIERPDVASSFAHRWWHRLAVAHIDDTPRSGIAFTVAAYAVAACEGLLYVQGQRQELDVLVWLQKAARHIEVEHGRGVDLVLVLRAARLLQPLLERASLADGKT